MENLACALREHLEVCWRVRAVGEFLAGEFRCETSRVRLLELVLLPSRCCRYCCRVALDDRGASSLR